MLSLVLRIVDGEKVAVGALLHELGVKPGGLQQARRKIERTRSIVKAVGATGLPVAS